MFGTILVPIDLAHAEWTKDALRHVDGLNDKNIRIVLLHVVEPIPAYAALKIPKNTAEDIRNRLDAELEAFAKEAGSNVITMVREGSPASTILKVAETQQADLIVIGSHQPGFKDRLLGSTATRVVRDAKCSVLVSR